MHPELQVRKRMLLMTVVLGALFLLVIGRLWQLTVLESETLTRRGVSQWTKEGIVTARRGTITDRNNNVLALSATSYMVCADPRLVEDPELFAETLQDVLPLGDSAKTKLRDNTKGSVILKRQVTRDVVDRIRQLKTSADPKAGLAAITFDEDSRRWYPYGQMLAQVLGLTNVDSLGQSGLETQLAVSASEVNVGYEAVQMGMISAKGVDVIYLSAPESANMKLAGSGTAMTGEYLATILGD